MKLSVSNIAWKEQDDQKAYGLMEKYGFEGLEIAPTRIFSENPYQKIGEAKNWSEALNKDYGFIIPSMQSIWYGRQERLFGSAEERWTLLDYTKKAIEFAEAIGCRNLVFGCPANRRIPEGVDPKTAVYFFREIGKYAALHHTIVGIEANPAIYNTNYMNDTATVFDLIEEVDSEGFRLNLDVGTMLQNRECVTELRDKVRLINHVHISEPGLRPIKKRKLHSELKRVLSDEKYQGFISIEMSKIDSIYLLEEKMQYVRKLFG